MTAKDADALGAPSRTLTAVPRAESPMSSAGSSRMPQPDIICLSHLRWDFVSQRPQHLMSRAARDRRVFYVQPPVGSRYPDRYILRRRAHGLSVVAPAVPLQQARPRRSISGERARMRALAERIDDLIASERIRDYVLWYYTPYGIPAVRHLEPLAVVYDCMDELSLFKNAARHVRQYEAELFERADVVFTGGRSLYEAKRDRHPNVHEFPSSVDVPHFARARTSLDDPADQARIARPRLGYFGVIDERMDMRLVQSIADARADWQLVFVGPVAKIGRDRLAHGPNVHYLGKKDYEDLPGYLAGWDVAIMPFARNDATRFISPTKTPEYLAAGKPVVSTSIRDVVHPYGEKGLVRIADTPHGFIDAVVAALADDPARRVRQADLFLERLSWDRTWAEMDGLLQEAVARRRESKAEVSPPAAAPGGRALPVSVRAAVRPLKVVRSSGLVTSRD